MLSKKRCAFSFSLTSSLVLAIAASSQAEIPITGGQISGQYTLYQLSPNPTTQDIESTTVTSFELTTPNGKLTSPNVTFSNDRNAIAPFLESPTGTVMVDLSGMAFAPNGAVVMFSQIPTRIEGRLDPSSVQGAGTLTPSGQVIVTGGVFNLGSTTITGSDGRTFTDSTLSFDVINRGTDLQVPQEVVTIDSGTQERELAALQVEQQRLDQQSVDLGIQRAEAERERNILQSRLNELALRQAVASTESNELQNQLSQLINQKVNAEATEQTLQSILANDKREKSILENQRVTLLGQNTTLQSRLDTLKAQQRKLMEQETKLVETINRIANDKTVERTIASIEREFNAFSGRIDRAEKFLLFINDLRGTGREFSFKDPDIGDLSVVATRKDSLGNVVIVVAPPVAESVLKREFGVEVPDAVGAAVGALERSRTTIIKLNPLKALFDYFRKPLTAANIADWATGASQAIADAKLQNLEQRAKAVQQLSDVLRETRASLEQTKTQINQANQQRQQLGQQLASNRQQLDAATQQVETTQQNITSIQQQIAQIDQQIQQTQTKIANNQRQLNDSQQEIDQTQQDIQRVKSEVSQTEQKINQFKQTTRQLEEQQSQLRSVAQIERVEPLISNIFPAASMRQ